MGEANKERTDQGTEGVDKKNPSLENLMPPWKPGQSGNPKGMKPGTKQFRTLFNEAMIKLGKMNNKKPEDIEIEIIMSAISAARNGNFKYFKDLMDRLHGKAVQPIAGTFNPNMDTIANLISAYEDEKSKKKMKDEAIDVKVVEKDEENPQEDVQKEAVQLSSSQDGENQVEPQQEAVKESLPLPT